MARLGIGALSLTSNSYPSHRSPVREHSGDVLRHKLDSRTVWNGSNGYSVYDHEGRLCDLPLHRKEHRYSCIQGHRRNTTSSRSRTLRARQLKGAPRSTKGRRKPGMASWPVPSAAQVSKSTTRRTPIARAARESTRAIPPLLSRGRRDLSLLVFRAPGGTGR